MKSPRQPIGAAKTIQNPNMQAQNRVFFVNELDYAGRKVYNNLRKPMIMNPSNNRSAMKSAFSYMKHNFKDGLPW